MFGIGTIIQSIISGIVGPVFSWLSNKDTVTATEFAAFTETERAVYVQYLQTVGTITAAKAQANGWWGARLLILGFALPPMIHLGGIYLSRFIDSPSWAVLPLGDNFTALEFDIAKSFFMVVPALPIAAGIGAFLSRK